MFYRVSNGGTLTVKTIGSSDGRAARTFNVKSILPNDYNKLTFSNFFLSNAKMQVTSSSTESTAHSWSNILNSYNASTGVLSCNASYANEYPDLLYNSYTVVAVFVGFIRTGTINITANGTYDVTEYATAVVSADTKHTVAIRTKKSTNNQIYYGILVDGVVKRDIWYPYDSLTHSDYTVLTVTGV